MGLMQVGAPVYNISPEQFATLAQGGTLSQEQINSMMGVPPAPVPEAVQPIQAPTEVTAAASAAPELGATGAVAPSTGKASSKKKSEKSSKKKLSAKKKQNKGCC